MSDEKREPRIVDSGPISIELSWGQAVSMLVKDAGLEDEFKDLVRRALINQLKKAATQEVTEEEQDG